jgi:F-type H+-transporting ATPase subunit a
VTAAVLTALILPKHPLAALSLAAGQLLAALNFFFLEKLVKLFTHAFVAQGKGGAGALPGRFFAFAFLKVALVYGATAALTFSRRVDLLPLLAGFSLPLLALFLKSLMLAFGSGPNSLVRRAPRTAATSGNVAKPAALFLILALLAVHGVALASDAAVAAGGGAATGAAGAVEHAAAKSGGGAEHAAVKSEGGAEHLPNWIILLNDYFPHNPVVHWLHENEILVFAWFSGLLFLGITWIAMRRPKPVPGQLQNAVEWIVESMDDVCGGLLGAHKERYIVFICALFFYILTINLLGIIPGFMSATSSLDLTLALALITFAYVQFWGIRNLGILGYLDHMAGSPRDPIGFAMLPVMVPVHILGELAKPVSLSCRLFGNIFGEDTLIVVFVGATALLLKASLVALAIPPMLGISALFMMLQTLTAIVQALIFSLLATVYLYMMLPHEEHAHGETEPAHS